ncbi:hypothetical protein BDQ17DRAFT_1299562 [Cyathus striatus]|nr:hypothetical protein BDQ17DRAFT_1299562 [Cyathus striatus]
MFQQHLGTNYVPSVLEIGNITNSLKALNAEVHDIDAEIEQLQQKLHLLQEKKHKVVALVEQHQALLSPARRLPQDILEEIFLTCLPKHHYPCLSATESPMLLTRICSSWRSIALSTPLLWAAIHVVLPNVNLGRHPAENTLTRQIELVRVKLDRLQVATKEWLDRSGTCPLFLSVYRCTENRDNLMDVDWTHRTETMILDIGNLHSSFLNSILVPYSQRWYDIDLYLSGDIMSDLLNELSVDHMQMLKKLHITKSRKYMTSSERTLKWKDIANLWCLPLTCVTVDGLEVFPTDLGLIPHLNLGHLTELNMGVYTSFRSSNSH